MSAAAIAALAIVAAFIAFAVIKYRVTAKALEQRGKPKWHAFFGFATLLEIMLNKPLPDRRRGRHLETSQRDNEGSAPKPASDTEQPIQVERWPPDVDD